MHWKLVKIYANNFVRFVFFAFRVDAYVNMYVCAYLSITMCECILRIGRCLFNRAKS